MNIDLIRKTFGRLTVLPDGFMRIRSFGFWSNASKNKSLKQIRLLLPQQQEQPITEAETNAELIERITGQNIFQCKQCKIGQLKLIESFPSFRQSLQYLDTS